MSDNFWMGVFFILIAFLSGSLSARIDAHREIATECVRQGSFYLNDKGFNCSLRNVEGDGG